MSADDLSNLQAGAAEMGLTLNDDQLKQFRLYRRLLLEWNSRINLTAIDDPATVEALHFLDSLTCTQVVGELNGKRLIDVGSGAGFPGLPLKIIFPKMALTLVESVAKKARFLSVVVAELGLSQVTILIKRAEALGQDPAHREQYDWSVARAVAAMPILAEYLLPLVRVGGYALAMKGDKGPQELALAQSAVHLLGGDEGRVVSVTLPGRPDKRVLLLVEKIQPTPVDYPRAIGLPAKRPLR